MNILFDIGGTKTRVSGSKDLESFSEPVVFPTSQNYQDGLAELKKAINEVAKGEKIEAIAGGIAGPWSQKEKKLLQSRNLPDWVNRPLQEDLEKEFNSPVLVDNDSAMVGLGEAVYGAGKGFSIVAYVTVSTGVGGARIVDGVVDHHSAGFEPGKQIMSDMGETLEDLVSGAAVQEQTGEKPKDIHDEVFWGKLARKLARGLHNTVVNWSPNVLVLGGAMIGGEYGIPFVDIEKYLVEYTKEYPEVPPLKKAELGDFGGLWGAMVKTKNLKLKTQN